MSATVSITNGMTPGSSLTDVYIFHITGDVIDVVLNETLAYNTPSPSEPVRIVSGAPDVWLIVWQIGADYYCLKDCTYTIHTTTQVSIEISPFDAVSNKGSITFSSNNVPTQVFQYAPLPTS